MVSKALGIKQIEVGLDLDRKSLERIGLEGVHRLGIEGDARTLPFRDNMFSTVFFSKALQEIPEPHRVLSELYRVLMPGEKLFLSCALISYYQQLLIPDWYRKLGLEGMAVRYEKNKVEGWLHHRTDIPDAEGWLKMVRDAGFTVEHSETFFDQSEGKIWDVISLKGFRVFGLLRLIPCHTVARISAKILERTLRWLNHRSGQKDNREGGYFFIKAVK